MPCESKTDLDSLLQWDQQLDARNLSCPLPLLKARQSLSQMHAGEVLWLRTTDRGSLKDMANFARLSGHLLLRTDELANGEFQFWLKKAASPMNS